MARDRLPIDSTTNQALAQLQRRIDDLRESPDVEDAIVLDMIAEALQYLYDAATEGR